MFHKEIIDLMRKMQDQDMETKLNLEGTVEGMWNSFTAEFFRAVDHCIPKTKPSYLHIQPIPLDVRIRKKVKLNSHSWKI